MSKISEQRRLSILTAAYEEFSSKGMERASMVDIARRAGIGKSTIYEYFSSKTELLTQACVMCMEDMRTEALAQLNKDDDVQQCVEQYCLVIWRYIDILTAIGPGSVMNSKDLMPIIQTQSSSFSSLMTSAMTHLLIQGQQRGEIATDIDLEAIAVLLCNLPSPLMSTALQASQLENGIHRLIDGVFRGLQP